jgi:hypothetical protein
MAKGNTKRGMCRIGATIEQGYCSRLNKKGVGSGQGQHCKIENWTGATVEGGIKWGQPMESKNLNRGNSCRGGIWTEINRDGM